MTRMDPRGIERRPTVQLLHELADGSRHVDWLIAQDPRGREPLISFRVEERLDTLAPGQSLEARRIAEHRPRYLDYEGPISGGRGSVRRLGRGSATVDERPGEWRLEVVWEGKDPQRLRLEPAAAGRDCWRIEVLS